MTTMFTEFDGLFPQIDPLKKLNQACHDAVEIEVPRKPSEPAAYVRGFPGVISLNKEMAAEFAKQCDMHPDELGFVLEHAFRQDNPMVVDAFKKLISVTKLASESLGEKLTTHRNYVQGQIDYSDQTHRDWQAECRKRLKIKKRRDELIESTQAAFRKGWLDYVRALEKRYNDAGGDVTKLSADDQGMYARAKRSSRVNKPFEFLRRQKADKGLDILHEVRADMRDKLQRQFVKKALNGVNNPDKLQKALKDLNWHDGEIVYNSFMMSLYYDDETVMSDRLEVYLIIGHGLGYKSASHWAKVIEERRNMVLSWKYQREHKGLREMRHFMEYVDKAGRFVKAEIYD